MNELIKVNYNGNAAPSVSGRELHEALGVETPYHKWFPRMCEYGFSENEDYLVTDIFVHNSNGGKQSHIDHNLTIPMAKELCMLQRTEKGKEIRRYFIAVEEQWNSPEAVMARALQFSEATIRRLQTTVDVLETTVAVQQQQIQELTPKACYYDVVLNRKDLLSISKIAKDYGWSAVRLNNYLHDKGVQYKQGNIWLLYQKYAGLGYTSTKTHSYNGDDGQQHSKVHTYWTHKGRLFIYDLLKADGILPVMEREEMVA